jgi:hypothetical protein
VLTAFVERSTQLRTTLARHPHQLTLNTAVHVSAAAMLLKEGFEIGKQPGHWTPKRIISPIPWRCPGIDTPWRRGADL